MRRASIVVLAWLFVFATACTSGTALSNDAANTDVGIDADAAPSCPTSIPSGAVPVQIAGGRSSACVLLSDATVACWSAAPDGSGAPASAPFPVCGVTHAVELAVGNDVACARIDDGTVRCWPLQSNGGNAVVAFDGIVDATHISAGLDVCVFRSDHSLQCSQFLNGAWLPVATPIVRPVRDIAAGSAGDDCAVLEDGSITCWRHDPGGAVASQITNVHPHDAQHVSVGNGLSCALTTSGAAECWGTPLPMVERDPLTLLTTIPDANDLVEIRLGARFGCARTSTGTVLCFGNNADGELGDRTRESRGMAAAPLGSLRAIGVAAFDLGACVLTEDHAVYCFGDRRLAPVSADPDLSPTTPVMVPGIRDATDLVVGPQNACARTSSAWVCWGSNVARLIDPAGRTPLPPTDLGIGLDAQPAFGAGFACVRDAQGSVSCWGENASGQLGDGTTTPHADRRAVPSVNARSIVAGNEFACALASSDVVYCWGTGTFTNPYGESSRVLSPMAVAGLSGGIRTLVANDSDSCVIDAGGVASCWGVASAWGGEWPPTPSATEVGRGVIAVAASSRGGCIAHDIGTVECWGSYAPAIDPLGARAVDVAVGGATACLLDANGASHCWGGVVSVANIRRMYAREEHGCLLGTDGTVSCWGTDGDGFLGRGVGRYVTQPTRFGPWGP